jgi:hypothetical protein
MITRFRARYTVIKIAENQGDSAGLGVKGKSMVAIRERTSAAITNLVNQRTFVVNSETPPEAIQNTMTRSAAIV